MRAEAGISKGTIIAEEFEDGVLVKKRMHKCTYDKNGNTLTFTSVDSSGIPISSTEYQYSEDGKLLSYVDKKANGEIEFVFGRGYGPAANSIDNWQLNSRGDTLVHQRRLLNKVDQDSVLYRKIQGRFIIQVSWQYDEYGDLFSTTWYAPNGTIREVRKTNISRDGSCVKYFETSKRKKLRSKSCNYST